MVADQGHEQIGKCHHGGECNTHHQGHLHARGDRQSRADTQDLQGNGVVVENGIDNDSFDFHSGHASPDFRLERNLAKPSSPIQKRMRLSTPRVVRVAPDRPSTRYSALGLSLSTAPLMTLSSTSPSWYTFLPGQWAFHRGLSTSPPRPGVSACS